MKFRFFSLIIVVFAMLQVALVSVAGTIIGSDIDKFIKTMEVLKQQEQSGHLQNFDVVSLGDFSKLIDQDGKMMVFRRMEKNLQAHRTQYGKLRKATEQGGFSMPGEWARVGDSIMLVYMRSEIDPNDLSRLDTLSPEVIAMMPPAVQAQMASAVRMMKAVENVSDADLKALKPYKKRLEKALD